MKTVSDIRVEKRVKELHNEQNFEKVQSLRTERKERKIKEEKARIIECLNQNYFNLANSAMRRLIQITEEN